MRSLLYRFTWWEAVLPKLGFRGLVLRTRPQRLRAAAAAYRELAVRMGGVLIKVGQFLSARADVLPREITSELSGLQDEVEPEPYSAIRSVVEEEFSLPIERLFEEFASVPTASASIGQVHAAKLCRTDPEGTPCPTVMVKVQRPHIREIIEADLEAIRKSGRLLMRFRFFRKRVDIPSLIEELSRSLSEETDYLNEAANAERFASMFRGDPRVRIPSVVRSHTSLRVLTLEDVTSIKINDYGALAASGIDREAVARRLLEMYLKQIFEDGFFHADPHPGNLFVEPAPAGKDRDAWKLVFVDFGMTGTLSRESFTGLREALMAVGTRDAGRLLGAFRMLDLLLPGADEELVGRAVRKVFDSVWGKSAEEILSMNGREMKAMAREFRDLLYDLPFQVPETLILLGRCLGILSGIAVGLDPRFNPWNTLEPYAKKLVESSKGGGAAVVLDELTRFFRFFAGFPGRTESFLSLVEGGKLEIRVPELYGLEERIVRGAHGLAGAIVFAALLLSGTQLYIAGNTVPALVFAGLDALIALWLLSRR